MAAMTLSGTVPKFEGGTILPYQRDTDNSTDVVLTGTYSGGTPSGIQVSWKGGAFTALTNMTIAGGTWTGTFGSQAGDEGALNLRWTNDVTATATTYFALGDGFLLLGDSIAVGAHVDNLAASATPKHTRWFHPASGWVEWNTTNDGPDSGAWPLLGDEITASQSVPVFLLNPQTGSGTRFNAWVHGQTGTFDAAMTLVSAAGFTKMRAVLVHLGVNNVHDSGNTSVATKTAVEATCADLNTYLPGGAVPIFWAQIGPVDTSSGTLRTEADAVRQGLINAMAAGSCYLGPSIHDLTFADTLHPTNTNAADVAGRWWLSIADVLYSTTNGQGPRVSAVTYNPAKDTYVVTFDKALGNSVSSSTIGFRVLDGVTPMTVSSQTVTTSRKVTLVTSAGASGTPSVSFGSGNDAIGASAPKGAVETLPSSTTVRRVAEVVLNHATAATTLGRFGTVFAGVVR